MSGCFSIGWDGSVNVSGSDVLKCIFREEVEPIVQPIVIEISEFAEAFGKCVFCTIECVLPIAIQASLDGEMLDKLEEHYKKEAQKAVNNKAKKNQPGKWKIQLNIIKGFKLASGAGTIYGLATCAVACKPSK